MRRERITERNTHWDSERPVRGRVQTEIEKQKWWSKEDVWRTPAQCSCNLRERFCAGEYANACSA